MDGGRGMEAAEQMMANVASVVTAHRFEMIPFRRRNFESKTMVQEILRRNNLHTLASVVSLDRPVAGPSGRGRLPTVDCGAAVVVGGPAVSLLYSRSSGGHGEAVADRLREALRRRGVAVVDASSSSSSSIAETETQPETETDSRWLLLVLVDGALHDSEVLRVLRPALSSRGSCALEVIHSGWSFGSEEHQTACALDPAISRMFAQKEFLADRPPRQSGGGSAGKGREHWFEHDAMVEELLRRYVIADARLA
jgi:hypothetical protein